MECCICDQGAIDIGCGHFCCKTCLNKISTCPVCRRSLGKKKLEKVDKYREIWVSKNYEKMPEKSLYHAYGFYDTINDCYDRLTVKILFLNNNFIKNYKKNRGKMGFNVVEEYRHMEMEQIRTCQMKGWDDDLFFSENIEIEFLSDIASIDVVEIF